jgi:hypothetical protein
MESKDYERHSETIAYSTCACCPTLWQSLTHLGAGEGYARASNLVNKSGSKLQLECTNLQTRIKPLSNDSVRHTRRQNTHTAGGARLEPATRKHVVPTFLLLNRFNANAETYMMMVSTLYSEVVNAHEAEAIYHFTNFHARTRSEKV